MALYMSDWQRSDAAEMPAVESEAVLYREVIPDAVWMGQDAPGEAVAGAIQASQDYASGLMVAVYRPSTLRQGTDASPPV